MLSSCHVHNRWIKHDLDHWWNDNDRRQKPVAVPLCTPQIPHTLSWERRKASVLRGRRLTTWAMAWRSLFLFLRLFNNTFSTAAHYIASPQILLVNNKQKELPNSYFNHIKPRSNQTHQPWLHLKSLHCAYRDTGLSKTERGPSSVAVKQLMSSALRRAAPLR